MHEFTVRKALSKIGYKFDANDLTQFEAEYLTAVSGEFSRLESDEIKNASKARGKGTR
jgi:hypothetical protein